MYHRIFGIHRLIYDTSMMLLKSLSYTMLLFEHSPSITFKLFFLRTHFFSFSFILIVYRVLEAFLLNATLIFTLIIIITHRSFFIHFFRISNVIIPQVFSTVGCVFPLYSLHRLLDFSWIYFDNQFLFLFLYKNWTSILSTQSIYSKVMSSIITLFSSKWEITSVQCKCFPGDDSASRSRTRADQ